MMYYEPKNPDKKNIDDNVKERVHTIKDLEPWRLYRIQVACQSSGRLGPYSKAVEKRTDPGGELIYFVFVALQLKSKPRRSHYVEEVKGVVIW